MTRLVGLAAALLVSGCSGEKKKAPRPPPVPVKLATAVRQEAPMRIEAIGRAAAVQTVDVKPRVDGVIEKVAVEDGQHVKRGELLFTLDRRPFLADLAGAEANLKRDRANAANAAKDATRYSTLVKKGYVSREQADQRKAAAKASAATVGADLAALKNARLRLAYTRIRAPLSGRAGAVLVNAGNVVTTNQTTLLTINQLQPIYVDFSVPEKSFPRIRARMKRHILDVDATPRGGGGAVSGTLIFSNNQIDEKTGTVQLRGIFPNRSERLWPGEFVDVAVTLETPLEVMVPEAALQTGQAGLFVWVVKKDNTVEMRQVISSRTVEGQAVIDAGLRAGERVVTDGQLRLSPGTRVRESRKGGGEVAQAEEGGR